MQYIIKIGSNKFIKIPKIVEHQLTLQQNFLKFMWVRGVTKIRCYILLRKLRFLSASMEK